MQLFNLRRIPICAVISYMCCHSYIVSKGIKIVYITKEFTSNVQILQNDTTGSIEIHSNHAAIIFIIETLILRLHLDITYSKAPHLRNHFFTP